ATSSQTAVVAASPPSPVNLTPPTISGSAQRGLTLTASPGSWSNEPTSYEYRGKRCDATGASFSPISGAGSATYTIVEADVGTTLRVTVTASNSAGPSAPAASAQTEVVTAPQQPPVNTAPPTISGTAQQGQTLTESHGSWTNEATSFGYEWLQCDGSGNNCSAISGATGQTYIPVAGDVGPKIG